MSAVPPAHFRTAPLLPAGELGCGSRPQSPRAFEGLSLIQQAVLPGDTAIQLGSFAELLVCEQRVHVCGGREAEEQAVKRPGEQRPMKQSRKAKGGRHESKTA